MTGTSHFNESPAPRRHAAAIAFGVATVLALATLYLAVDRPELYEANLEWFRAVLTHWFS